MPETITEVSLTPVGSTISPAPNADRLADVSVAPPGRKVAELRPAAFAVRKRGKQLYAPDQVRFGGCLDHRLRFVRSIRVDVSRKAGTVVAHWSDIDEFGYGDTLGDALNDLGKTLSELYFGLTRTGAELGPEMMRVRARLSEFIEQRPVE